LSPYAPAAPAAPTVVRLQFSGANPAPEVRSGEALPGTVNYFIGSDPAQWQTNLSTYAGVVYADLYDGIDLVYDGTRGTLKGTYTVAPGSDPARIGWRYAGAEDVRVDAASGNLHIRVAEGHTLTEHAPIAWQTIDGERVPVAARYTLAADGRIGFALGAYDDTHPLIIDPTLEYSTYLGGGGNEAGKDIAVDSVGNVYIVGNTTSTDFPTFSAYQDTYGGGTDDVFISKLSSDGSSLLFSTFLGGTGIDAGYAIALDDAGNAYITGSTDSTNFPTVNAYQDTHGAIPFKYAQR
jgi:hypothetical protein